MGAFRKEKAKRAHDDLMRAPQTVVEQRAEVIKKFYAMYELFTDSDGFLSALGAREMQDFYDVNGDVSHTLQFSLHETCLRLGQKRAILYGYSPDKVLKYDLDSGVFTSPPDLSSSAGLAVSVLLTDMDATQEVSLSTNTVSNTTVYTPSPTGLIANSFSNYAGNYYLVRDKNTGSIVDFDDNPTPYLNLPFLPANTINDIPYGPEPEDPTAATDMRFDFKLNDENLAVMDRYVAKPTIKMFLNTVSPENAFIVGETVVLGTDSAVIYEIQEANTDVMTVTFLIDEISNTVAFAGQTANLELQQPAVITTGKEIRGLTSTAKGLISSTVPAFRWKLDAASIEFDENAGGANNQDYFIKDYATMNVDFYTEATALQPAKLYMRYNLQEGIANQVSGQVEEPRVTPSANVTNPTLLQTFGLKRWVDMSPLDDDGIPDGSVQPHTTGLLAVSSARGLQINYNWYNGTGFLTLNDQDVTKMDQATWEGYLGYLSDDSVSSIASANPDIMSTSTPTDINDSHNGRQQFETSIDAGQSRLAECFPDIELNPHYPAVDAAYQYPDQMPYANTFVKYNLLRPTEIDYIIYAFHRWTYQVSPMEDISHGLVPGGSTYQTGDTVSRIDPAFQRLKNGKLSTGANWNFNNDWTIPGSTNANPPADNTYGPLIDTGQSLGNDSPFAGPGASSSTAGYIANGQTGQVIEGSDMIVGEWYVKSTAGRVPQSGVTYDGEHILRVKAHQSFFVNDYYTTTQSTFNVFTQSVETETVTVAGNNRRYYTLVVNSEYYDHNVNTMRKLFKTSLSGMSVSASHGYYNTNDFQYVINCLANLENPSNWSESHLEFEDQFHYDFDYNTVSGSYPLSRVGSLKTTDATFNAYVKAKAVVFRAVNTYNNDFWTNFGLSVNPQTWSPPADAEITDSSGNVSTSMLQDHFESWRDTVDAYTANIAARIGVPHIFVSGTSGPEPEIGSKSYSGMLYAAVSTMLSGSTGEIKGIKNAINNIQSIYDDVAKKRKVYKTYGPVDTIS